MYNIKIEQKIEFTNEESLLIPSFKRETTIAEREVHENFSIWVDPYKRKIEQLEKQNYILWKLLPRVMHRFYVDADYSGYLPKISD